MKYNNNSKFSPSEQELEQQRKEMLIEMNKLDNEIRRSRNKKIIIITTIIVIVFSLFKILIGEINITIPNLSSQHRNRLYDVSVNNTLIDIGVEETKRTTIIPFIIYINDFSSHMFFGEKDENSLKFEKGNNIILKVDSYECYTKNDNIQLSCVGNSSNAEKVKTEDTSYTLRIKKLNRDETITYNGKFINNISAYFTEKGKYRVFIIGKYKNVTSTIYFNLEII